MAEPALIPSRDQALRPDATICTGTERGLWYASQTASDAGEYNLSIVLNCNGEVQIDVLRQALAQLVHKHAPLSFIFPAVEGVPTRAVRQPRLDQFQVVSTTAAEADRDVAKFVQQRCDLHTGPLVRARLFALGPVEAKLAIVAHHLICDGQSLQIIADDVVSAYAAASEGSEIAYEFHGIDYLTFAARIIQRNDTSHDASGFWKGYLLPQTSELRFSGARGEEVAADKPAEFARRVAVVGTDDWARRAREFDMPLFSVCLAGLAFSLARSAGVENLHVAVPVDLGGFEGREGAIGNFVNTVIVAISAAGCTTFHDYANCAHTAWVKALDHRDTPLEQISSLLRRGAGGRSLPFQLMLGMVKRPKLRRRCNGVAFELARVPRASAICDAAIDVVTDDHGYLVSCEYDRLVLDRHDARRLVDGLIATVSEGLATPDSLRLSRQNDDVRQALFGPNPALPSALTRFENVAGATPDVVAIETLSGQFSYADLSCRAREIAGELAGAGVLPGDIVAIRFEHMFVGVAAILATWKLSCIAAVVPADAVAGERDAYRALKPAAEIDAGSGKIESARGKPSTGIRGDTAPDSSLRTGLVAYIVLTSGSTGHHRAVAVSHDALASTVHGWEVIYGLDVRGDRHLQLARPSFDVFFGNLVRALCFGGTLVEAPADLILDPAALVAFGRRRQISFVETVPAVARVISAMTGATPLIPTLRVLAVGSDLWVDHEFHALQLAVGPEVQLFNTYGLSEAAIDSLYFRYSGEPTVDGHSTLGLPLPGVVVAVIGEDGAEAASGEAGELLIGGDALAVGYAGDAETTQARFVWRGSSARGLSRFFKTRDKVRLLPNGELAFLGRVDSQLSISGCRVEPEHLESLAKQVSGVTDAGVTLTEGRDGGAVLVLHLVAEADFDKVSHAVRNALERVLAPAMRPRIYRQARALPRSANGKLDRLALSQMDVTPGPSRSEEGALDRVEMVIAAEMARLLGVAEALDRNADYFQLGGSSLKVAQLFARLEGRLGVNIPLRMIYDASSVRSLAHVIRTTPTGPLADAGEQNEDDAFLADVRSVRIPQVRRRPAMVPADAAVLVTGATGRLGGPIADRLADEGRYRLGLLLREAGRARRGTSRLENGTAEVLWGDLATASEPAEKKRLARALDGYAAIIHLAASVNFVAPYRVTRRVNVEATLALLDVAAELGLDFHYCSSASLDAFEPPSVDTIVSRPTVKGGYNQAKWVGERACRLAAAKGLSTSIYRLGHVISWPMTKTDFDKDLFWAFIKSCAMLGSAPDIAMRIDPVSADTVARVFLEQLREGRRQTGFKLVRVENPRPCTLADVAGALADHGAEVKLDDPRAWLSCAQENGRRLQLPILPFMPLLSSESQLVNVFAPKCAEIGDPAYTDAVVHVERTPAIALIGAVLAGSAPFLEREGKG